MTISDLIADVRAPTPSAAAEAVVPDGVELAARIRQVPERLGRALRRTAGRPGLEVRDRLARLVRAVERRLQPARQTLDRSATGLERSIDGLVRDRRARAGALAGRLEALSPLSTLARGYAVARTEDGRFLLNVEDFRVGQPFRLSVKDGVVDA